MNHRAPTLLVPVLMSAAGLLAAAGLAGADTQPIIRTGQALPGHGTPITGLYQPVINDSGQVAFGAYDDSYYSIHGAYRADGGGIVTLTTSEYLLNSTYGYLAIDGAGQVTAGVTTNIWSGDGAVYLMDGNTIQTLAQENQAPPDGFGAFDNVDYAKPVISDTGAVAFYSPIGSFWDGSSTVSMYGAYRYSEGALQTILRYDNPSPDGVGTVTYVEVEAINDSGVSLLYVRSSAAMDMVTLATPGSATVIAAKGQTPPEGNGTWVYWPTARNLNNAGQATFTATVQDGGGAQQSAAYLYNGSTNVKLIRVGEAAPDGDGHWSSFSGVYLNESGNVFATGHFSDAAAGTNRLYRIDAGGGLHELVRSGQAAPDGDGTFSSFSNLSPGDGGMTLFLAQLSGTSRHTGLFITDGEEIVEVARIGDTVPGGGASFGDIGGAVAYTNGRKSLNSSGQVAFYAREVDPWGTSKYGIYVFTPELHYRGPDHGDWAGAGNWTLGLEPSSMTPVAIDPNVGLAVNGPSTPVAVKRLTVDALSSGTAVLSLDPCGAVTAIEGSTIGPRGEVSGSGQLLGRVAGTGVVRAAGGTLTVGAGGSPTDFALTGGLAADAGATLALHFSGPVTLPSVTSLDGGSLAAPNGLDLPAGATLSGHGEVQADVTNGGAIAASGGTLWFGGRLAGFGTSAGGRVGLRATGSLEGQGTFAAALAGEAGSSIAPTGDVAIGDAASSDGFNHQGRLTVGTHTAALNDADQANIGGLTTIDGGTLTAPNGLHNTGQVLLGTGGSTIAGGTFTNDGLLRVTDGAGHAVSASLTNTATGKVETFEDLLLSGPANSNAGRINVMDATLHVTGPTVNAAGGKINAIGATLQFDAGLTNEGELNLIDSTVVGSVSMSGGGVAVEGTALFEGDVSGNVQFTGSGTAEFAGGVRPGASPGVIAFEGGAAFRATAELDIEVRDNDNSDLLAPHYDTLAVAGDVALGGSVALTWLPLAGDPSSAFGGTYTILSWRGTRTGMFDAVGGELAAYLDTSVFAGGVEYDDAAGEVRVHLLDLLAGDADLNGQVDREDFIALKDSFGTSSGGTWRVGDFNFDGRTDYADYLTMKGNLGSSVGGGVPEPASLLLMLSVGACLSLRRRR